MKLPFVVARILPGPRHRHRTARLRRRDGSRRVAYSPGRIALGISTTVVLALLLCIHLWPNRVDLQRGDVADREILALRTVRYEDTEATARLRADASTHIEKRYDTLPDAASFAADSIRAVFDAIEAQRGRPPLSGGESIAREIRRQAGVTIEAPALRTLLALKPEQVGRERALAVRLVEKAMAGSLRDDTQDVVSAREALKNDPLLAALPQERRAALAAVAGRVLQPNLRFNARETARAQQQAESAVRPQMRRIAVGAPIIRAGERVTQQHLDAFTAMGLRNATLDASTAAVISALVVLLVLLALIYLRLFHRLLYDDTPRLLLLSLLTTISVLGLKIGSTLLGLPFSGVHFAYLGMMCVASAGMVVSLLLSPSVAILIVSLLSAVSGLVLNNELRFAVITMGSSLVGIVAVASLRNRGDLMRAALLLCGANAVLNGLVGQLAGDLPSEMLSGMLWGVISGLFALVLFWLGVAALERLFGITTHLRLLELADPATPILQEFRMKVPGTYAHSLMVGNLAHTAAETIGADALLVRVAAYYHDLGKMNRPEFFIENQGNAENIHDRLSPSLSAIVLASHVKEGLELAASVGLPPRVREVIQQHHGTTLMKYFYHRATGGVPEPSLEPQFRYAGPKPRSKEAAILMLADGVEAASRTLERPSPQRIRDFVVRMIDDKRADGQLDECDLTLRDLKAIEEVFVRTLCATLHARIDYPGNAPAEPERPAAIATHPAVAFAPAALEESHGDPGAPTDGPAPATLGTGRGSRQKTPPKER